MFEEKYSVIGIEVDANNKVIQVRGKKEVLKNGTVIAFTYHDCTVQPGDDYSTQDAIVQAIAATIHTPEVITAYKAKQAEMTLQFIASQTV